MTLKSVFKATGTDTTEPCSRTSFDTYFPRKVHPAGSRSVVQIGRAFVLLEGIAAVNDDQLAGDVGGGFGGEKRDGCGDFVRTAGAADRSISTRDNFVRGGGRGFDPAGGDGVHSDSLAGQFEGKTASKPDHAGFGRAVGGFARVADDWAGGRRNVHDTPIVRSQHERQNGFRDIESGFEVDSDAVIPLLFGKLGQR